MTGFTLKVQARSLGVAQFRWEIYEAGNEDDLAVLQAREFYETEAEAWEAGRRAVAKLEERAKGREDVNQRAKRIVDRVTGRDADD